jgi:hypothetical protein
MPRKRAREKVERAKKKRKGSPTPKARKVKVAARLKSATPRKAARPKKKAVVQKRETRRRLPTQKEALRSARKAVAAKKTAKKTPAKEREFQAALKRAVRQTRAEYSEVLKQLKKQAGRAAKKRTRKELSNLKRKLSRRDMIMRAVEAARSVPAAQAKRFKKRSRAAIKGVATKNIRDLRHQTFGNASHKKLVRHIHSNTPKWQEFVDAAERSTSWDSRRIRDEYFSPTVKKRR